MNTKFKNMLFNNIYAISLYARKIAGAFCVFFIARYLSVHDYGMYASYANVIGYLFLFANLGFNEYILVSSQNNVNKVRIKQSIFIIFGLFLCFLYALVSMFVHLENHLVFLLIIFRSFFDGAFFALALPYFQAAKKFNQIGWINIFYSVGIILIAISSLMFKLSLINFLTLCIILGIINFIQCSIGTKINYLTVLKRPSIIFKMIDKSILSYMGVTLLMVTRDQLPSLSVSTLMAKEQAALYFAAFNIAAIPSLFAAAKLQQIMPQMIKATSDELIKIMKKGAFIIFIINLAIIIFLILFGKTLLILIYNKGFYLNAYLLLLLLLTITLLQGTSGVLGFFITARGFQKFKLKCQLEFVLISIITILFVFKFGITWLVLSFVFVQLYALPRYGIFIYNELKRLKKEEEGLVTNG